MTVVQINTVCGSGSTGKICVGISEVLNERGIENYILYCSGSSNYSHAVKCSQKFPKLQALKSRVFGNYGLNSETVTKRLIKKLESINPTVVHLHNLHGHNVHLEMLFNYLKDKKIKIVWTFHDCWAFTAYCPYFDMVNCHKWKTGCYKCAQYKKFSWFFDRSKWLYKKKQSLFSDLDLKVITPSEWLAALTKNSFLGNYPVEVINNGIDLTVFKPSESMFRKKYKISDDKIVLLGVAINWEPRKSPDVFIRLSELLDNNKYQIVMVGTDTKLDKKLPSSIISIHRTESQQELAEIYSDSDLFVNPTLEENFPTVNIEALACGTPVLTYKTGGSPEMLDYSCGIVVERNDFDKLYETILSFEKNTFSKEACIERAKAFDKKNKFIEYVNVY